MFIFRIKFFEIRSSGCCIVWMQFPLRCLRCKNSKGKTKDVLIKSWWNYGVFFNSKKLSPPIVVGNIFYIIRFFNFYFFQIFFTECLLFLTYQVDRKMPKLFIVLHCKSSFLLLFLHIFTTKSKSSLGHLHNFSSFFRKLAQNTNL